MAFILIGLFALFVLLCICGVMGHVIGAFGSMLGYLAGGCVKGCGCLLVPVVIVILIWLCMSE
jgi:hypothetical protein